MTDLIDARVKDHQEWLNKNGARIYERNAAYLREDLQDCTCQPFQHVPSSLGGIATYFGIQGIVDVIEGDIEGWNKVSSAIDFRAWALKIRFELFLRQSATAAPLDLTNYTSTAACLVCTSEKWGPMAETVLRRIDCEPAFADQRFWLSRRFEPFVIACCRLRDGASIGDLVGRIGEPYRNVLLKWDDPQVLEEALAAVCDYHCRNMDDTGGDWDPEFKHSPFDLLPCELLLVNRVREELGLSAVLVEHPLLRILNPRSLVVTSREEHELLQEVSAAFGRLG